MRVPVGKRLPMTEEEFLMEIGSTFLSLVYSMNQLGHVTLKGHLVYHHEEQYEPIRRDVIAWLRWHTAFGKGTRDDMYFPQDLVDEAVRMCNVSIGERIAGI